MRVSETTSSYASPHTTSDEQPAPQQQAEEAEDDPWKIALRRHFRLVKYRVFEATRFQNIGLAANFEEKCSQTSVFSRVALTNPRKHAVDMGWPN